VPVHIKHPGYSYNATRWAMVRKVIANNASEYIRLVDTKDLVRSQQYREDAILTNFTKLTRDGLVGLVFRKPPTVEEMPEEVEYLKEDATGEALGLDQLAVRCTNEVLQTGRYGLLIDAPMVTDDVSPVDDDPAGRYARIKPYVAEAIVNYRCKQIGSKYVLSMVVLEERENSYEIDRFTANQVIRYRVLELDEQGYYAQSVLDAKDNVIVEQFRPTDYNGNPLREIPFVFIGSENNDPLYDNIPLYDLTMVNIGHYRNSADLEESGFICGQPFPVVCVGEGSIDDFKAANEGGVNYGSRSGLVVSLGGNATLLQANPNNLIAEMMKEKLAQAAALGARLIAPATGTRETAEGAKIRYGSQNSALYILTHNVSKALERAIKWVCVFQGAAVDAVEYMLNKQFYEEGADPNLIVQQIQLYDRQIISAKDIIDYGKKTGFIADNRTEEQMASEAELNNPLIGTSDPEPADAAQ